MTTTALPLWGNVLIRPIAQTKETKSGLVLPESAPQGKIRKGAIISCGDGSVGFDGAVIPMKVKAGDIVLFKIYEAEEVSLNGETLFMVDQRQIVSTLLES